MGKTVQEKLKEHQALEAEKEKSAKLVEACLAVLCDPEGKACFEGSDGDRAVIDDALAEYKGEEQE